MVNIERSQKIRMFFHRDGLESARKVAEELKAQTHEGAVKMYVSEMNYLPDDRVIQAYPSARPVIYANMAKTMQDIRNSYQAKEVLKGIKVDGEVEEIIVQYGKNTNRGRLKAVCDNRKAENTFLPERTAVKLGYDVCFEPLIPEAVYRRWIGGALGDELPMLLFMPGMATFDQAVFLADKFYEMIYTAAQLRDQAFIGFLDNTALHYDLVSTDRYYTSTPFYECLSDPPAIFKVDRANFGFEELLLRDVKPGELTEQQKMMLIKDQIAFAMGVGVSEVEAKLPGNYQDMEKLCREAAHQDPEAVYRNFWMAITQRDKI